jgi:hypothetical protein
MKEWPRPAPGVPLRQPRRRMPVVKCVPGVKNVVFRAKTLPRSHLTQIDQMKDSPIA